MRNGFSQDTARKMIMYHNPTANKQEGKALNQQYPNPTADEKVWNTLLYKNPTANKQVRKAESSTVTKSYC